MGELSFHVKANHSFCSLSPNSVSFTSQNYNDRSPQVTEQALVNAYKMNPPGNTKGPCVSNLPADTKQLTLSHSYQHFNPFSESPTARKLFGIMMMMMMINAHTVGSLREKFLPEREIPGLGSWLCYY